MDIAALIPWSSSALKSRAGLGYKKRVSNHYLYVMDGSAQAPAGDGDVRSWFLFYKWNVEGEVFVPRKRPFLPIAEGDYLWFVLDQSLVGYARVTRVEEERNIQEIWYFGDQTFELDGGIVISTELTQSGRLPAEVAEGWLTLSKRSIPPSAL